MGLELARDIKEAAAAPVGSFVGSFVTPISDLSRGKEDNKAIKLPIPIKPVIYLMKGKKDNVGHPPSSPPVVRQESDPPTMTQSGSDRLRITTTEIPFTWTQLGIKESTTIPL